MQTIQRYRCTYIRMCGDKGNNARTRAVLSKIQLIHCGVPSSLSPSDLSPVHWHLIHTEVLVEILVKKPVSYVS